jgi:hypothetical protein
MDFNADIQSHLCGERVVKVGNKSPQASNLGVRALQADKQEGKLAKE